MEHPHISSRHNPQVKFFYSLRTPRGRVAAGAFLIEGAREIEVAQKAGLGLTQLWLCPELIAPQHQALAQRLGQHLVTATVTPEVFSKCCYRENPDGFLASAPLLNKPLEALDELVSSTANPLVLVVEALEKPGNLGAILRCAEALGVHALLLTQPRCDLHNPNLIRSSQGLLFELPLALCSNTQALAFLQKHNLSLFSTHAEAPIAPWKQTLTGPCALILGNEHAGVSSFWPPHAQPLRIPQLGQADSLNVSTAAGILLYEAQRQRQT